VFSIFVRVEIVRLFRPALYAHPRVIHPIDSRIRTRSGSFSLSRPRWITSANEAKIVDELEAAQGPAQDIGGYYEPDAAVADQAMRPSATLNEIIAGIE